MTTYYVIDKRTDTIVNAITTDRPASFDLLAKAVVVRAS